MKETNPRYTRTYSTGTSVVPCSSHGVTVAFAWISTAEKDKVTVKAFPAVLPVNSAFFVLVKEKETGTSPLVEEVTVKVYSLVVPPVASTGSQIV